MATLIEYSTKEVYNPEKYILSFEAGRLREKTKKPIVIGYLNINPKQALEELMPNFYVVGYSELNIPSKSKIYHENPGLIISEIPDGIGLVGTIEMLEQNELFKKCRHQFSKTEKEDIFNNIKEIIKISQNLPHSDYHEKKAKEYSDICNALGFSVSTKEILKLLNC